MTKSKLTCCFTGHRPDKLYESENDIKLLLTKAIDDAICDGCTTFISGMAMGVDIWAAEIVIERMTVNSEVSLICALPHPDFEKRRSETEIARFNNIIASANDVVEVNNHYYTGCYQVRNKWMVDRSSLVIAVFNGKKSGTKNTIDYANKKSVKVVNVLER